MTLILYVLVALLGLKLVWNLGVPYELARRNFKEAQGGISLMPFLEMALLLLAAGAAAMSTGRHWINQPQNILIFGGLAIVGTYVHMVLAGTIAGWVVSVIKQRRA